MAKLVFIVCFLVASSCYAMPPDDFIAQMAPIAQEILPSYGLFPSVFIAQCALESGWGESYLAKNALNYFGRKCGHDPCIEIMTSEYYNGHMIIEPHYFQKYNSLEESVHDYAQKYFRKWDDGTPIYKMDASSPFTFILSVAPTYATDVNYAHKIIDIIVRYNLEQFD